MGHHRVRQFFILFVTGSVLLAACGGDSASRDRNVDVSPTTQPGEEPQGRDLTFTETFADASNKATGTTASWGDSPGKLTMKSLGADDGLAFSKVSWPALTTGISPNETKRYVGPSEFIYVAGDKRGLAVLRPEVEDFEVGRRLPTRLRDESGVVAGQYDDVTQADLDNDGVPETIAVASGKNQIDITDGTGRSTVVSDIADDKFTRERFVVADFSGDGLPDIARVGRKIFLFIQRASTDGTLAFDGPEKADITGPSTVMSEPYALAAGDVNGDGRVDLVMTGLMDTGSDELMFLIADGREVGKFSASRVGLRGVTEGIRDLQVADVDGKPGNEVLVTTRGNGIVHASFAQVADVDTSPELLTPDGEFVFAAGAGDVDGDGVADVAYVDGIGRVFLRLGVRGGSWAADHAAINLSGAIASPGTASVRIRDVNGDGRNDISIISFSAVDNFVSRAADSAATVRVIDLHDMQNSVKYGRSLLTEFVDVNLDGQRDVILCAPSGRRTCFVNVHSGGRSNPYGQLSAIEIGGMTSDINDIAVSDVTGDGWPDLLVATAKSVIVLGNTRRASMPFVRSGIEQTITFPKNIRSILVSEMTGDAYPDMIVAFTQGMSVLKGAARIFDPTTGSPRYFSPTETTLSTTTVVDDLYAADLAGNGRVDFVGPGGGVMRNWVKQGNGWSSDASPLSFPTNRTGRAIAPIVADFTGDGRVDAMAVTDAAIADGKPVVQLMVGKSGKEGFGPRQVVGELPKGSVVLNGSRAIDLNFDGLTDLAVPVRLGNRIVVHGLINRSSGKSTTFDQTSVEVASAPAGSTGLLGVYADFYNEDRIIDLLIVGDQSYRFELSPMASAPVVYSSVDGKLTLGNRQVEGLYPFTPDSVSGPSLLATSTQTSKSGQSAVVLRGDKVVGAFRDRPALVGPQDRPITAAATGRLDDDALEDIVVSRRTGLDIYTAKNSANWGKITTLFPSVEVFDVAIGRVTRDGHADIVAATKNIQSYYQPSKADSEPCIFLVPGERVEVVDLDKDGLDDVVALRASRLYIYRASNGQPALPESPTQTIDLGQIRQESAVAGTALIVDDLNGDGQFDAVLSTGAGQVLVVPGPLSTASRPGRANIVLDDNLWQMQLMDVNADGLPDLVGSKRPGEKPVAYLNSGNTAKLFDAKRTFDASFGQAAVAGLGVLDLNRDGLDDLVVGTAAMGYSDKGLLGSYVASIAGIYGTAPRLAVSKALTNPTDRNFIEKATLTATTTAPEGSSVAFEVTNNGSDWYAVESGVAFTFPSNGAELSWRAKLSSSTGMVTPTVTKVVVAARAYVPPAVPTNAVATSGDASLTVTWQPGPVASGGVVKTYKVVDPESDTVKCVTTETMCVVSGLQNGKTYALRVVAENPAGAVVTQVTGQLTPTALPAAPGKPVLKPIEGGFEVSWKATFNDATDAPIERYVVKFPAADKECVSQTTTCTITGLVAGQSYVARVAAVNVRGQGDWSALSEPAAPLGRPVVVESLASQVAVGPTLGGFRVSVPTGLFSTTGQGLAELKLLINGQVVCSTKRTSAEQPCGTASNELFLVSGLATSGDGASFMARQTYEFSLVGVNEAGDSEPSPVVRADYLGDIIDFTPFVVVGDGELTVSWQPPVNAGPNFSFTVSRPGTDPCVVKGTTTTSCNVTGLTNGSFVTLDYLATNGFSEVTGTVSGVPAPIPEKVTDLQVGTDGREIGVSWSPPTNASQSRIVRFEATLNPGGEKCTIDTGQALSCRFADVKRGDTYSVEVQAIGASGRGASTRKSIVVATQPGQVGNVVPAIAETSVTLTWSEPADNGGTPIIGYDIPLDGSRLSSTTTSYKIDGLTPGQRYEATVAAKNETGQVGEGTKVVFIPMGMPGAPKITSVEQSADSVVLKIKAPTSTGGTPIVAYDCVVKRGEVEVVETSCGGSDGQAVVLRGDASAGDIVDIAVIARNSLLPGVPSESVKVKLADRPGFIGSTSILAAADGLSFDLTFDAPSDGGSPITRYELRVVDALTDEILESSTTVADKRRFVVVPPLGRNVRIVVAAVNSIGVGPGSSPFASILVYGPPSEPKITKLFAGDGEVYVEWDPPVSTGGAAIEAYTVEAVAEGETYLPSSTEIVDGFRGAVFRGLENGVVYRILVTVSTQGGDSTSTSEPVVPIGAPDPVFVRVDSVGDGFADVSWDAPKRTGGLPVTGYVVTTTPEGGKCDQVDNRCRLSGLTNGVGYVVSVAVRTDWGVGRASLSGSFTPLETAVPESDTKASTPTDSPARVSGPNLSLTVGGDDATGSSDSATSSTVASSTKPVAVGTPRLRVGQKVALRALVAAFKIKLPKGSVALLDVKTAASRPCAVTKRFVTGRSVGQCRFTILVQPRKGKTKRVNVNVEVVAARS